MPTDVPAITQAWYDELAVGQPGDDERGQPLMLLLGAVGVPFRQLHDLVRDTPDGPGWSALFDPDRCPDWALPWLAQAVGLDSRGQAPPALREQIRGTPRFKRGTRDALIAAVQTVLAGDRVVRIIERDSSPYHLTVVVRTSEAPASDVVLRAALTQKPAGLVLAVVISDAPLIDEGTRAIDAATATIDAATLADVT